MVSAIKETVKYPISDTAYLFDGGLVFVLR